MLSINLFKIVFLLICLFQPLWHSMTSATSYNVTESVETSKNSSVATSTGMLREFCQSVALNNGDSLDVDTYFGTQPPLEHYGSFDKFKWNSQCQNANRTHVGNCSIRALTKSILEYSYKLTCKI